MCDGQAITVQAGMPVRYGVGEINVFWPCISQDMLLRTAVCLGTIHTSARTCELIWRGILLGAVSCGVNDLQRVFMRGGRRGSHGNLRSRQGHSGEVAGDLQVPKSAPLILIIVG